MYDLMIWHSTESTGKRRNLFFFVLEVIPTCCWDIPIWTSLSVMARLWCKLFESLRDGLLSVCLTWWFQFELKLRAQDYLNSIFLEFFVLQLPWTNFVDFSSLSTLFWIFLALFSVIFCEAYVWYSNLHLQWTLFCVWGRLFIDWVISTSLQ